MSTKSLSVDDFTSSAVLLSVTSGNDTGGIDTVRCSTPAEKCLHLGRPAKMFDGSRGLLTVDNDSTLGS